MSRGPLFPKYRAGEGEGGDALARAASPGLPYQTAEADGTTTRTSGAFIDVESATARGLFYTAFRNYEPRYTPFEVYPTPGRSSFNEERAVRESRISHSPKNAWRAGRPLPPASLLSSAGYRVGAGVVAFLSPAAYPDGNSARMHVQFSRGLKPAEDVAFDISYDNTGKFGLSGDIWATWLTNRDFRNGWARPVFDQPFSVAFAGAASAGTSGRVIHFGVGVRSAGGTPQYVRFENGKRVEDGKIIALTGQGADSGGTKFSVTRVGPNTLIGLSGHYAGQRYLTDILPSFISSTDWPAGNLGLHPAPWRRVVRPIFQISNDNGKTWELIKNIPGEIPYNVRIKCPARISSTTPDIIKFGANPTGPTTAELLTYFISDPLNRPSSASEWNSYVANTVYKSIVLPESETSALVLKYVEGDQHGPIDRSRIDYAAVDHPAVLLSTTYGFVSGQVTMVYRTLSGGVASVTYDPLDSTPLVLPGAGELSERITVPNGIINVVSTPFYTPARSSLSDANSASDNYDGAFGAKTYDRNWLYEVWRVRFDGDATLVASLRRPSTVRVEQITAVVSTPTPTAPKLLVPSDVPPWAAGFLGDKVVTTSGGFGPAVSTESVTKAEVFVPGDDSPFSAHLPISASPRIFADFSTGRARYLITDGVANDQAADLRGAERRRQYITSDFVSFERISDEPVAREFMGERRWLRDSIIVPVYAGLVAGSDGDKHEYHLLKSSDLGDTWEKLAVLYRGGVGEPPIADAEQVSSLFNNGGSGGDDGTSSDGRSIGHPARVMRALTRFNTVEWVFDESGKPAALNPYSGAWVCDDRFPAPKLKD